MLFFFVEPHGLPFFFADPVDITIFAGNLHPPARLREKGIFGIIRVMTSKEQARIVGKALEDAKGDDIKIYDMAGKSDIADAFVVATGKAAPHLKALAAAAQAAMKEAGVQSYRTSGDPESGWIVVDYIDIVLHVFSPEARAYYALEKLWEGAR